MAEEVTAITPPEAGEVLEGAIFTFFVMAVVL